jgi:phosphatidylinositol alpha-mannosyltransferase
MDKIHLKIGLFSAHSFATPGGVQRHIVALYSEFQKRGHQVKILAPGKSKPEGVPSEDFIPIGISGRIPGNGTTTDITIMLRKKEVEQIQREKFDILHFHNLAWGFVPFQISSDRHGIRILTLHASQEGSLVLTFFPPLKMLLQGLYGGKFDGVIGVSPVAFETFRAFYDGPTRLIPNGIDLQHFSPDGPKIPKLSTDGNENLLFVGRFEPRKGLIYLLKAYELVKKRRDNARLIIVGDGEEREEAEYFIQSRDLRDVSFEGFTSEELLPAYYRTAKVFCAPALYGESFGMVLLEAMACGTPIAGFSNPGYAWVMKGHEKKTHVPLLVPPKDYRGLAKKIELLLDRPKIYESARTWGLARCKEFAWPRIADEILQFYADVRKSKKPSGDG